MAETVYSKKSENKGLTRQFERQLLLIIATWQMIDGFITIGYYGVYRYYMAQVNQQPFLPGYFTVTVGLGVLFIGCGLVNIYLRKQSVKDNQLMGLYVWAFITQAIMSFAVADSLSLVLLVAVIVVALAKNKAIKAKLMKEKK